MELRLVLVIAIIVFVAPPCAAWLSTVPSLERRSDLCLRRSRGVAPLNHSQWKKWRQWRKKSSWEWMDDWQPMSIGEIREKNETKIMYDRERKQMFDRAKQVGGGEFM